MLVKFIINNTNSQLIPNRETDFENKIGTV